MTAVVLTIVTVFGVCPLCAKLTKHMRWREGKRDVYQCKECKVIRKY